MRRSSSHHSRRPTLALAASLLAHAGLLSLAAGGSGPGLPGLALPWQARRADAEAMQVRLAAPPAATPVPAAPPAPATRPPLPAPAPIAVAEPTADTADTALTVATLAAPPTASRPELIALARPEVRTWAVPPGVPASAAVADTLLAEAARADAEAERQAQLERARQDAARLEAARLEAARLDAERQDKARQDEQARQAAAQLAAAQLAATQQAARLSAQREAARQAAAPADAVAQAAAQATLQATARADAAREAEAQREARLQAIGRQLNEEAARRDAARAAAPAWSSARRGRLFGRSDANAELQAYAEAWGRKIQLNPAAELMREAARQPHTDPLLTVAIRADGSVESVTVVRSSGVPALDEAIRRAVHSLENYPAFSAALARDYDVVEIRRSWHFDSAIRLY